MSMSMGRKQTVLFACVSVRAELSACPAELGNCKATCKQAGILLISFCPVSGPGRNAKISRAWATLDSVSEQPPVRCRRRRPPGPQASAAGCRRAGLACSVLVFGHFQFQIGRGGAKGRRAGSAPDRKGCAAARR